MPLTSKPGPYRHHTTGRPFSTPSLDEAFLRTELNRLEGAKSEIELERASVLQRLNAICSPIFALQPEILAEIFDYACSTLGSISVQHSEVDDGTDDDMEDTEDDTEDTDDDMEDTSDNMDSKKPDDEEQAIYDDISVSMVQELRLSQKRQSFLIGLGGVSVYWRKVSFEHPRLWTSVSLKFHRYTREAKAAGFSSTILEIFL